ncbi:MAG TPA: hypothetical protein VHM30_10335 [Gemmatimonadaceae bacterium]|nr:hypothetical protein [Gemmatimonadaceae bacterium]
MRLPTVALALVVATIATGCRGSASPTTTTPEPLTILNPRRDTTAYIALDRELATRTDPNPELSAATLGDHVLPPGVEKVVERDDIMGYRPGEAVTFWIYHVTGGRAYIERQITVPPRASRGSGYRVVVPPPPSVI